MSYPNNRIICQKKKQTDTDLGRDNGYFHRFVLFPIWGEEIVFFCVPSSKSSYRNRNRTGASVVCMVKNLEHWKLLLQWILWCGNADLVWSGVCFWISDAPSPTTPSVLKLARLQTNKVDTSTGVPPKRARWSQFPWWGIMCTEQEKKHISIRTFCAHQTPWWAKHQI